MTQKYDIDKTAKTWNFSNLPGETGLVRVSYQAYMVCGCRSRARFFVQNLSLVC